MADPLRALPLPGALRLSSGLGLRLAMDANPHPHSPQVAPAALLGDLRLEIEPLLARFRIGQGEAEEILDETLLLLTYRWERIDSREIWLLAAIKRACLRRLGRRRARMPGRS